MGRRGRRKRTKQQVRDFMSQEVNLAGGNQDPAIDELLRMLRGGQLSPRDQAALAAALQLKASGIEMPPHLQNAMAEDLAQSRKDEEQWETDRERFIENIMNDAEKYMPTEEEKEKLRAKAMNKFRELKSNVVAERAMRDVAFHRALKEQPTEKITVTGKIEMHSVGEGGVRAVNVGEVIRVNNYAVHLPPGEHEVPTCVAAKYREMMASRHENEERKAAMAKNKERLQLDKELLKISKKYGSSMELGG